MIVAEIYTHKKKITGFSVNGHANTAPVGEDIYCAGVSSLTQSAFLCLRDFLKRDLENFEADSGKLVVQLKDRPDKLTESVFQTMLIGMREIQKIAPQVLEIKEVRD